MTVASIRPHQPTNDQAQTGPILKFNKVSLRYGTIEVLTDIDFSITAGKILALVGPSGSGKTSLLMLAGGLESTSKGEAILQGTSLSNQNEDQLALIRRRSIGILFQDFHLHPSLTATENAALPLIFEGAAQAQELAAEQLRQFGLGHRLQHYPSQLSGGEQQRVAMVRAFINKPSLILADEPTGNLDEATSEKVISLLFAKIRKQQAAALIVTHDMRLARKCDAVMRLQSGKLLQTQT